MEWIRPPGAAERLTDILVPFALAAASSFAAWTAGVAAWPVAGTGAVAAVMAAAVLHLTGRGVTHELAFEPGAIEADELANDELLLEDRLALPEDSRVVRLFAPDPTALPGELAARIDDWLEGARLRTAARSGARSGSGDQGPGGGHGPEASPASAALHAALAGIRQSLR